MHYYDDRNRTMKLVRHVAQMGQTGSREKFFVAKNKGIEMTGKDIKFDLK
jgi:hypothetical protein